MKSHNALIGDLFEFKVNVGEDLSQCGHGCFPGKGLQISSHKPMGNLGYAKEIHIISQRHTPGVDFQYFKTAVLIRYRDLYLTVEPPGPSQGGIEDVWDIGGADNDNLTSGGKTVHQGQKLGYDPFFHLLFPSHLLALWSDGINLVNEYDAGCMGRGLFKYPP